MADTFTVEIKGIDQLRMALAESPTIAEPVLQRAIEGSHALLAKFTVRGTVPWKTGFLVHSFQFQASRLKAIWFPTAKYAIFVHGGTGVYGPMGRPFTITAAEGSALYWPGAAHPVKSVTIQGQKPNPFMPRIIQNAKPEIDALFDHALKIIVRDIAAAAKSA